MISLKNIKTTLKGIFVFLFSLFTLFLLERPLKGKLYLGKKYDFKNLITRSRNFLTNDINLLKQNIYSGNICHLPSASNFSENKLIFEKCSINRINAKKIYFVGNSHTDHLRETHFKISEKYNLSIEGVTVSTCVFPYDPRQKNCGDFQIKQKERLLNNLNPGDLVVISNRFLIGSQNKWFDNKLSTEKLIRLSKEIKSQGGQIILFLPTPEFKLMLWQCTKQWFRPSIIESCTLKENELRSKRKKQYQLIKNLSKDIILYDPLKAICFQGKCPIVDKNGWPLYSDDNHFTDLANREYIFKNFSLFLENKGLI